MRYCDGKEAFRGGSPYWEAKGATHKEELNAILCHPLGPMIRRLSADVLTQLPEKRRTKVDMILEPGDLATHKRMMREYREMKAKTHATNSHGAAVNKANARDESSEMMQMASQLYAYVGRDKRLAVVNHLRGLLPKLRDTKEKHPFKILVFAHHKQVIEYLTEFFASSDIKHIKIDGSVKADKRQDLVTEFQTKKNVRAAVPTPGRTILPSNPSIHHYFGVHLMTYSFTTGVGTLDQSLQCRRDVHRCFTLYICRAGLCPGYLDAM